MQSVSHGVRDLQFRSVERQTTSQYRCICDHCCWRNGAWEIGIIVMFNAAFPHSPLGVAIFSKVRQAPFSAFDQGKVQFVQGILAVGFLRIDTPGPAHWLPESAHVSSDRRCVRKFCRRHNQPCSSSPTCAAKA